ncbi:MAG: FAD-dependent oxidoreductase [Clostridia bacterium]|nr:FAD-dependent oxidoreductase [Clostridia bacterium]
MQHILEIDEIKKYDLVVCGGGFTGVACAYYAAKSGLSVALVESRGALGGVGTTCNVPFLLGGIDYEKDSAKYRFVVGGLFKKLYYDLRKSDDCVNVYDIDRERNPHAWFSGLANAIIYNVEKMKILLDSYIKEQNIDLMYFTKVIDVKRTDRIVDYVVCANKSGNIVLEASCFADCTGDGDIAALAGCDYVLGRDEDSLMAPASLIMTVDNVDTEKYLDCIVKNNSPRFRKKIEDLRQKGIWNFPYDILISAELKRKRLHMINTIRQVGIDGTNNDDLTEGMIQGRKENIELFKILKEHFDGFENAEIESVSEMIGIRETRRIIGDITLTLSDLFEGKKYTDIISLSSYSFDLPDPKKPSYQPLHGDKRVIKNNYTEIPYRCLIPKGINNLICPGRSISVERDVLGPIRVMGPCIGMGQAAGLASSILISCSEKNYRKVDESELQNLLRKNDCIIDSDDICIIEETI